MRKFIFNLFIFLSLVLVFNIIVFVFANDNYYKGYKDFPDKKFHSFVIADSHGLWIDKYAEKYNVYNFSASSDSYFDMKRKINYLIDNNYKIDKIYLTVDDHTLSSYREKYNNADKSIVYTSKIDYNYLKEKYLKYYFPIFQVKVNPLLKIYLENKTEKVLKIQDEKSNDVIWNNLPNKEKLLRAEERVSGQFPSMVPSEKLKNTLQEIITLCKAHHIELIGLKFPVTGSYLKALNEKKYNADDIFISKGLKVLDYQSLYAEKDEVFSDQDHLNFKGGKEFVKILFEKQSTTSVSNK